MTEPESGADGHEERVTDRTSERVISRECEHCGTTFAIAWTGRPARFCSDTCRQQAYALRRAEARLGTAADTRPVVVREVVERVTVRTVERRPRIVVQHAPARPASAEPTNARGWLDVLAVLEDQLADASSSTAREHWQHRRLYAALVQAVTALGRAHPGGLDRLSGR